jgi:hypothetical protein
MPNSQLDALLTTRYGNWKKPIASPDTFQASLPFVGSDDKSGKQFSMPILTAISQGATTDNTGGIVNLNGARTGVNSQAVLDGVNLYIQEQLSYSDLMKMGNGASESGDAGAYSSGPDWVMFSMLLGLKHHSEMMALYGSGTSSTLGTGGDIGVLDTAPIVTGTNISGAGVTVKLTTASWAKLLWLNSGSAGNANAGMLVDIYDTTGVTLRANKVRTVGVTDSTKCRVAFVATAGTTTGATYVPVAGDRLIPTGWNATSALGMSPIMQTVGTFAGLDNTNIPQWKPQPFDCGGTLITFDMFANFAAKLKGNGFKRGEFDVWAAPPVISALANQLGTLQKWENDAGQDNKTVGTGSVSVVHQAGKFNLNSYGYIKQGEILIIAKGEAVRIGAEDERTDGFRGEGLVLELQGQSGTEMRAMCQFAPLLTTPFWSGRMSNFTCPGNDVAA